MQLHELKTTTKEKKEKRVGRGGKRGTYSGKGTKGQKARAGHRIRPAIRDLLIRIPKLRGFANKPVYDKVITLNIKDIEKKIKENSITKEILVSAGLAKKSDKQIKILSTGEIKRPLNIKGILVSKKTREKIEAAGGKVE